MAKKSTKKAAEAKKVTSEELDILQKLQGNINNASMNLANISIAKYELLQDHAKMKLELQEMSQKLQDVYGEVNISLADGSITEIEK